MMEPIHTYTSSQGLSWCVDSGQTLVFDVQNGVVHQLSGYPAILWEWLTSYSDFPRLMTRTAILMNCPDEQAGTLLMNTLVSWQLAGLLLMES